MNIEKTMAEVRDLIAKSQGRDNIDDLIDDAVKISGYLVFVQTEESKAHAAYLVSYQNRKVGEADYMKQNMDAGMKVTEATNMATAQARRLRTSEAEFEADWKHLQTFRLVVSEYLDVLRTKISYLKSELINSRTEAQPKPERTW